MNKKNVVIFIVVCTVILVAVVLTLFLTGVFSTPKLEVYNLVTQNEVVKNAREEQEQYDTLFALYPATQHQNIAKITKVNNLVKITTNVVEEYTSYVLFVIDDGVKSKSVKKAYEQYLSDKKFAHAKLLEALSAEGDVNYDALFEKLLERYEKQAVSYNNFCNELKNYTQKACFETNPKTLKYTLLTFCQNFNSYMVNNYIKNNDLNKNIQGISINKSIFEKYVEVKNASSELVAENLEALDFVDKFYVVDDLNKFYELYSMGESAVTKAINDGSFMDGKDASKYGEQHPAWEAVIGFITKSSYLGGN